MAWRTLCQLASDRLTGDGSWPSFLVWELSKNPSFCRTSVALFGHGVLSLLAWARFCRVVARLKTFSVSCFSPLSLSLRFLCICLKNCPRSLFSPQQSGTYDFGGNRDGIREETTQFESSPTRRQVCSARPRLISAPSALVSTALCESVLPDNQCRCWVGEKTQKQVKCFYTYVRVQHPVMASNRSEN